MNSTNRQLLLFDIDLTLYDSLHFRALYPPLIAQALNISLEELHKTRENYLNTLEKSTDFLPEKYLQHIASAHAFPYQQLQAIYYDPQLFRDSLYPDTLPALNKLQAQYHLGIYTEGYPDFQLTKLKLSGIYDYFDPDIIFIHRRKIDPVTISRLPSNAIIIDDRIEVIDRLCHFPNLLPIWLNRQNSRTHPQVATIHTLTNLS